MGEVIHRADILPLGARQQQRQAVPGVVHQHGSGPRVLPVQPLQDLGIGPGHFCIHLAQAPVAHIGQLLQRRRRRHGSAVGNPVQVCHHRRDLHDLGFQITGIVAEEGQLRLVAVHSRRRSVQGPVGQVRGLPALPHGPPGFVQICASVGGPVQSHMIDVETAADPRISGNGSAGSRLPEAR